MTDMSVPDSYIRLHAESRIEDELARLVAQPSVAAQKLGIDECADLVAEMLRSHGFEARIMPTEGSPVVYGEGKGQSDKTLLFYLHYDVQPAEPLDLWDSDPWTLTRRDDTFYGRGISDDKGNIVSRLLALDAIREANGGELPVNIKFVIEGEEEVGSVQIPAFVEAYKDLLAADACVWEFGTTTDDGRPKQVLGMRGICFVELRVRTASYDAHSGLLGSAIANAAWRLTWALSTLKDHDERILIPGYYDSVVPPSEYDLELLAAMPDDSEEILERYQASGFLNGMTGGPELRRASIFEPTCTIAGLTSGYQGPGSKTIVPAEATAKVDFRLVPNQSPEETLDKLRKHLDAQGFEDVEVVYLGGGRPARVDPQHPFIQMSNQAMADAFGKEPVVAPMSGGSGPNYPFTEVLGLPITLCGGGYPGTRAHAPNENIRLDLFIKGAMLAARITDGFSRL